MLRIAEKDFELPDGSKLPKGVFNMIDASSRRNMNVHGIRRSSTVIDSLGCVLRANKSRHSWYLLLQTALTLDTVNKLALGDSSHLTRPRLHCVTSF